MKPILVLFATRHGLSRRIGERLSRRLEAGGHRVVLVNAAEVVAEDLQLSAYGAALLIASVHMGAFHAEIVKIAREHRAELDRLPTMFFAVSMTAAGITDPALSPEEQQKKRAYSLAVLDGFVKATGWTPMRVHLVAGALPYLEYNPFLRLAMRWISKRYGSPTDTSRNHELTDWNGIDRCADELLARLAPPARVEPATATG